MPKTSKTFKKKKYNSRFPPARIKKIMQMDEEVGKVAAAVPVIISRALEMFIESLVTETSKLTQAKNAKTLSTSHIKQTIKSTKQFDFLCDLVKNVPDHQAEDNGDSAFDGEPSVKRGKGRPRKVDGFNPGKKRKSGGNKTSSDEDDEDDEDDEGEDTETDEESTSGTSSCPVDTKSRINVQNFHHQLRHSPFQPALSNNEMSHNNNNNYVPSPVGSTSQSNPVTRDSLISGINKAHCLHHQSLPLSSNSVPLHSEIKHPLYQMSSNADLSSSLLHQMPPKGAFYNSNELNPAHIQTPVPQTLQQQPIDLTNPLRQNCVNEDDDYDT